MKARFFTKLKRQAVRSCNALRYARGDPDLKSRLVFHTADCWIRFFGDARSLTAKDKKKSQCLNSVRFKTVNIFRQQDNFYGPRTQKCFPLSNVVTITLMTLRLMHTEKIK